MVQHCDFSHWHSSSFEDYFTTARKDRYNFMCSIDAYGRLHPQVNVDASSGGGIPLPYGYKKRRAKISWLHTKLN